MLTDPAPWLDPSFKVLDLSFDFRPQQLTYSHDAGMKTINSFQRQNRLEKSQTKQLQWPNTKYRSEARNKRVKTLDQPKSQESRIRQRQRQNTMERKRSTIATPAVSLHSTISHTQNQENILELTGMLARLRIESPAWVVRGGRLTRIRSNSGPKMFDTERLRLQWEPKFHQFGRLPPELRLKIWKLAMPRDRVLKINSLDWELCSPAQVPMILHVSREARVEALKVYGKPFRYPIYSDTVTDTLFFERKASISGGYRFLLDFAYQKNFWPKSQDFPTSIAVDIPLCESLCRWIDYDWMQDLIEVARRGFCALEQVLCVSVYDPKIPDHELEITTCPNPNILSDEKQQRLEAFFGVKLTCGHLRRSEKAIRGI